MGILDLFLSLFTQGKAIKQTATTALADSLAKDVAALESGKADPALKKAVMGKAKKLIQEIGGVDAIIGGYAVSVRFFFFLVSTTVPRQHAAPYP